jgi:hypothetical protein
MYTSADGNVDLEPSRATAWVGWIVFAALMMIMSGIFSIIWGIVALARKEVFVAGRRGNVINLDFTAWGWIHLILGVLVLLAGFALFRGALWAGIVAIVIAVFSAVGNLLVIGSYPIWSTIVIALDVLVIYAITVHGGEMRNS